MLSPVLITLSVFLCLLPGKAQANEQRYTKLKEKYTELVQSHADLLRKVRTTENISCSLNLSLCPCTRL